MAPQEYRKVGHMTHLTLTRAQVREIDRQAIDRFGIPGAVLMENAGRNATGIILPQVPPGATVAIVCGRGNNGGDGFVIARHLDNAGVKVEVFLACDTRQLTSDAALNFRIVECMDIPRWPFDSAEQIAANQSQLCGAAVIVDAVLGTGFSGQVRPPLDRVIHAINQAAASSFPMQGEVRGRVKMTPRVIAIDVPSGLECDTGQPSNATIRAHETITFVALKKGFSCPTAVEFLGRIHIADIGAPRRLIEHIAAGG